MLMATDIMVGGMGMGMAGSQSFQDLGAGGGGSNNSVPPSMARLAGGGGGGGTAPPAPAAAAAADPLGEEPVC